MSYIGSTPTSQNFISGTDYFNGTGSQTAFTLTRSVNSVNDVEVVVNNVIQQPNSYTISGTTLTLSAAPSSGTSNVYVRYISTTTTTVALPQDPAVRGNLNLTTTAARITADFSNATTASRVMFQTSTANSGTFVGAIANGTVADNTGTGFLSIANSDAASSHTVSLLAFKNLESRITSGSNTGTYYPLTMYTGGSERLRIDTSGNVGIGTASPNQSGSSKALTVNASSGYSSIELSSGGASKWYINSDGSATYDVVVGNQPRIFYVNGSERMAINSSGEVGIGVSPISGTRLKVKGVGASASTVSLSVTNGSGTDQLFIRDDNYLNSGAIANYPTTGTTLVLAAGNYIGYLSSSIKFKKDVVDYDKGLDVVNSLRPVYYRSSQPDQDGNYDERTYAGFIAEEVKELGLEEYIDYNDKGEVTSLKYAQMTAILCKAIQEQQAMIEELKTKVAALEAK